MGFENAPKMSPPGEAEIRGRRPGIDPEQPDRRFPHAGGWAIGLGVCSLVYWYVAPFVVAIAVAGIVSGARRRDQRELGMSIGGLCLAGLGVLLALVRAASSWGTNP